MNGEVPLPGGNMNDDVVRAGNTVRRAASPQSATIQRLLAHVTECGVDWVPQPLGFDDAGREVWSFIPGEVVHGEPDFRESPLVLADVAAALREWHDATATFARSDQDVWAAHEPVPAGRGAARQEVIAHNDFAPYNHVFRGGTFVGAIDFDVCYPATREWDLAWTVYRYVYLPAFAALQAAPAQGWGDLTPTMANRIVMECALAAQTFARSYGGVAVHDCIVQAPARLRSMSVWCGRQRSPEHRAWGQMYAAHARWLEAVASRVSD